MIKQIPILLVVFGIVILLLGVNLVLMYDLSFFTGILVFFGIAMLVAGIDLKRKIKKLNAKNKKDHHDYTISKLLEELKNSDNLSQISYEMSSMEDIFKMQQMYGLKKEEQEIQEQLRKMGYID